MNSLGFNKPEKETRVVVAMSGGVDSSAVAALLHEQGYEVVGITLQLYDHGAMVNKKGACCAGQDIHDARRVAESLGIPHYVLNYESRFKQSVMDDFADSYLAGETPIPCVKCNQSVKFKDLLQTARELGADCMATGHYVQRMEEGGQGRMHRAADLTRDQSYFLFGTTQEQLDFLRFPLGHLKSKEETRALAARFGLLVADKPDSQDICFVPSGGYAKVIEKLRPGALEPGEIVHVDGRVLGQHDGIINYTVGQRKGLGIGGTVEPLFVIKLDAARKQVVVGPKEALLVKQFTLRECNWLDGDQLRRGEVMVKLRSMHPGAEAVIHDTGGGRALVELSDPQSAVSPGQACVAYVGDRLIGGGWITA
ncbi:MAG: tRNA 2-thiouridine(34) synthase MnmA [Rickettsiales bacterium]|jgi:tRNA-specific 2-thiouridylase|nr:tRNA 2-thiouridine(34) synthase MnmA [Rickettsiales bacterium]